MDGSKTENNQDRGYILLFLAFHRVNIILFISKRYFV